LSAEQRQLEAGIAALATQRALLGDAVVDAALAGLQARLAALRANPASSSAPASAHAPEPAPTQTLKQVAILFLDVVGSTTLSQHLDPEETSAVMDGVLRRGTAIVQTHRGRVLQTAGDSILAVFGADHVAEDDTERAVHCGLALLALGKTVAAEILAAHGRAGVDVRVGVHTGGVLLGGDGGGAGDDSAIRGLAVNIAARMEQTAPAGALRISHDSYVQVRGLFEVSAPELLQVKGVDQAIISCLVHKAKPRSFRMATRGIEGVVTRMIGRETAFEALQAAFQRVLAERHMLTVSVVAEAGIGKSRLLDEFRAWTEDRPETVFLFRGRATPQTQGQPFGLLRDIVAWRFQLSDDDTLDEAKVKLEQGLMPLFADEPDFAQGHAHLLGHLIGLSWQDSPHLRGILDDPKQIRSRAQHSAAQMFRRVSASNGAPVMLLLEDLHWADDDSLDFLNDLAEVNRDMPLLMLAFTRPTLFERRSDWRRTDARQGHHHARIDLHPLDKTASLLLVNELLKKLPDVPAAVQELIAGRADGNPFYMEELVRMLIDQGAIDASGERWRLHADRLLATQVPPTLTGVLQARLDGLPAAERLTLQEASVIGQFFWDLALLALDAQADTTLPRLVQRELAVPRPGTAADGLREYAFKHAILHQVTYATVLKRQRLVLHGHLAAWLAAQSQSNSARAGDFLGLTAQHFEEAGDDAHAAEFHARAAAHAAGRLAHAAAHDQVQQALALLDKDGDRPEQAPLRWRLLRLREHTWEIQGDRARQALDLDEMDRMAQALGDGGRQAYVAYRRAYRAYRMADWDGCMQSAQRAVALGDAAPKADQAHAAEDSVDVRLPSQRLVGVALMNQGLWDPALALLQQTLAEARARGLVKPQAECLNSLAMLAARQDDPVRSLALHRECLALWRQTGDRRAEAIAVYNIGAVWLSLGDLAAARQGLEEGLRLGQQNGDRALECAILCGLSELALWQGDDAHALAWARSALDAAVAVQARELEASAWIRLGDAEAAQGRQPLAAQAYAHAQRVEQEIGNALRFGTSASLARLALAQGDLAGARLAVDALLSQAQAGTAGVGDTDANANAVNFDGAEWPRLIELTVHRVYAAEGDPKAAAWLQRAHRALLAQADAISDAGLRQMFLANIPQHRDILALWAAQERG
jgi:class 3 adenylate cyclase